jgi:cell division ATPase FtsA
MSSYSKSNQSSDKQFDQYDQFNQFESSNLDSTATIQPTDEKDLKQYCLGIDLGSNKITICRTSEEANTDSIADMMDIRSIPNLIVFPQTKDQSRSFGNNATFNKALCLDKLSDGDSTKNIVVQINDTDSIVMPIYIVGAMIMGDVQKIVDHRIKNLAKTVIVPNHSDQVSNVYFETFGIKTILCSSKFNGSKLDSSRFNGSEIHFATSSNALILSYIERYGFNKSLINKNIAMIDMGHSKTQITVFSLKYNKINNMNMITHRNTYNLDGLSGKLIDDAFCLHIASLIKNKYPGFRIDKFGSEYVDSKSFRSVCIKAKHQLSINQTVQVNLQGLDSDICITVTRQQFDDILEKNNFGNILENILVKKLFELMIDLPDHTNCIEVIGATSRIPFFRSIIQNAILDESRIKIEVNYTMNPDEAVGNGASFYGHLLNEPGKLAKSISFRRIVNDNVLLLQQGSDSAEYLFKKSEKIRTNFDETMPHVYDGSDTRSVCIDECSYFDIKTGNVTIRVNLLNRSDGMINVHVRYNLCDLIEIVEIRNSKNESIDFSIEILVTDNGKTVHHDLRCIENKFKAIESKIRTNEDMIERRSAVANFMESYYLDVANVNKLIANIVQDQSEKFVNQPIGTVKDVDSIPTNKLVCPLKEIYEFYRFCRVYGQESNDESTETKRKYIDDLLKDVHGLQQLEKAVRIVKNIMQFYRQ